MQLFMAIFELPGINIRAKEELYIKGSACKLFRFPGCE